MQGTRGLRSSPSTQELSPACRSRHTRHGRILATVQGWDGGGRARQGHLLEAGEGLVGAVDVALVHLVRQQRDALLLAELQDGRLVVVPQHLPRGVAGVDDHERAHVLALRPRLHARTLNTSVPWYPHIGSACSGSHKHSPLWPTWRSVETMQRASLPVTHACVRCTPFMPFARV